MRQIRTAEDIKQLGTILFVAAHPDDEAFMAGGILAAAVANGQRVAVFTATHGEAGIQNESKWPRDTLGDVRRHELAAGLRELGITTSEVFDFADGGCADVAPEMALETLRPVLIKHQPDTVLTFGADGMTGHPDHATVSAWVSRAVAASGKPVRIFHAVLDPGDYQRRVRQLDEKINLFFNIDTPPLCDVQECDIAFTLPPQILGQKIRALMAMPSQTERMFMVATEDAISRAFARECFVAARGV
jgi:LmbE family N-acetylglucosaminyl deacetylase